MNFIEGRRNKFKIDILKLKQEVIQKVGFWQPDVGVNISDPTAFYDSNIANITLVVMTREVCRKYTYTYVHVYRNIHCLRTSRNVRMSWSRRTQI